MEGGTLIWVEVVTREFTASHTTDGMDEVTAVEILKPVLVRIVGVGAMVKVHCRRVLPSLLVTSVLWNIQYTCNNEQDRTYTVTFLIEHKWGNGPTSVSAGASLTPNTDSGAAPAVLVLSTGDSASRHWHD